MSGELDVQNLVKSCRQWGNELRRMASWFAPFISPHSEHSVLKDVSFSVTAIPQLALAFMIRDKHGHVVWATNTAHTRQVQENVKPGKMIVFRLPFTCTKVPGSYSVSPSLTCADTHLAHNYEWVDNMLVFDVVNVQQDFVIGSNWLNAQFFIIRQNTKELSQ